MRQPSSTSKTVKFPLAVRMVMIDLDGTMIHTAPDIVTSVNRTLQDLGRTPWDEQVIQGWIGNGVPRLIKRVLTGDPTGEPESPLFEQALALFKKYYRVHLSDQSQPFPGAVQGLETLRQLGYELVCITNKSEAFTLPLLQTLGVHKYFKLVLSGDSLPKKKPDPMPLLHACQYFGIAVAQSVLIGDSTNDVEAARAAGVPVICVSYGYNHGEDISAARPDLVIDSLADVSKHLQLYV